MSLSSRHLRNPSPKRSFALLTIWGTIGMTVAGFGTAAIIAVKRPADAYAVCGNSSLNAAATTAIMVDATDSLTEDQRRRLKVTVDTERDRLPQGGRIIILGLNPERPWEPTALAAVCNPGKAEDSNPFFVTRSKIEKRWQAAFGDPIDKAVQQSMDSPTSERSPIIITVAAILARADFDTRIASRRLILISDLLEHEKGIYSQLRGGDFWNAYQASPLAKQTRLDLKGVSVAIDYLQRGKFAAVQGPRHQGFWQRLFTEAGASEVQFLGMTAASVTPRATNIEEKTSHNGRQ